jgi:hypothetical protein
MGRLLPPLVALAVLGLVAWRVAAEPGRLPERSRILGLVRSGDVQHARVALEDYARRYEGLADTWFRIDTLLRMGDLAQALDTTFGHPVIGRDPGTARRFALAALRLLGWQGGDLGRPTVFEPHVLTVLLEAGDEAALADQAHRLGHQPVNHFLHYWFATFQGCTRRPLESGLPTLRTRPGEEIAVAAALAAARPGPVTPEPGDVDVVRTVVTSPVWHDERPNAWHVSCTAYAKLGGEEARGILRERLEQALAAPPGDGRAARDEAILRTALLAGGDDTQREPLLRRFLLPPAPYDPLVGSWIIEAVLNRHRVGDSEGTHALGRIWTEVGPVHRPARERIAFALLLEDDRPDESALPVGILLEGLQDEGAGPRSHAIARSYLLRRGQEGALEGLIALLRQVAVARAEGAEGAQAPLGAALLVGLRALLLYGPSAAPASPPAAD